MFATDLKVIVSYIYMSFTIGKRVRQGQEANKPPSLPLPGDGSHSSLLLSPGLPYENLPSRCKLTHCRRAAAVINTMTTAWRGKETWGK